VSPLGGVVDVRWARPAGTAGSTALLDSREREQLGRLSRADDRARYVAAHALLRLVVARWWRVDPATVAVTATCRRCDREHGRPVVQPPPGRQALHVSVAHAGDRVVVAVTDIGPVGVDVEEDSGAGFAGFADVALASSEHRWLARLPVDRQLAGSARIWVRKEAVLKATGDGLSVDPRELTVSAPTDKARLLAWPDGHIEPSMVHLTDLELGRGYSACAALLGPRAAPVRLSNGDDLLTGEAGAAGCSATG
jgi:4'-phosphopantetheinyl transferase